MTIMKKIKTNGNMHTVIDIGNSKVCCLIGTTDKNKQLSHLLETRNKMKKLELVLQFYL